MQNPDEMLFFLLSIKHGDNVSHALMDQLGFSNIGRLCIEAQRTDLIIKSEKGYQLTAKGKMYIAEQNNIMGRKGIDREIAKLPDAKCQQISVNTIYIPEDF